MMAKLFQKHENTLIVNVIGGLCNRLLTIATGIRLAKASHRHLCIVWANNKDLAADFCQLFEPLPAEINLRQPRNIEYNLIWEMPRKRNLYLSAVAQRLAFSEVYSDADRLIPFQGRHEEFINEIKSAEGRILIISGYSIGGFDAETLRSVFRPSASVQELIKAKTEKFSSHTTGVHIRRTDNIGSIKESPLHLFTAEIEKIIDEDHSANFFIASDDVKVTTELQRRFGSRIVCGDLNPSRTSLRGMMHGTADLWALSMCSRILGSFQSSYSNTAAIIGDIPLKVCSISGKAW